MGVVGAGGLALGPLDELEGRLAVFVREHRLQVEQALVDAAQFFDIEGGVVDAPGKGAPVFAVGGEMPDRFKKVAVGEEGGVEILGPAQLKQVAVQGWSVEQPAQFLTVENAEGGLQPHPEVIMLVAGLGNLREAPEAADAVMISVYRACAKQVALFGNHEEQQAVDQTQELFV